MLARPKQIITLSVWSLERRGKYWHIVKPQFFTEPAIEKGPYSTVMSACLMIARELVKEATRKT